MTSENITRIVSELKESYEGIVTAQDGGKTLAKLLEVRFPDGCKPASTAALVALDPQQPKPQLFLKLVPTLSSGRQVNTNLVTIGGESWFTYSFNLTWDENTHTAVQFVEGQLRRFARNE